MSIPVTEQYNELPTTSEFLVSLEETDHDESSDRISTLFPSTSFKIRGDLAGLATNSIFFSRQFVKTSSGKSVIREDDTVTFRFVFC